MAQAQVLNADQLNALGKQTGYTGPAITSVGLPVATAPTSTAGVNPLPSVNMPTNTPTLGNTSNASAMNSGMDAQLQAQTKFFEDQMKLAKEQADALQTEQNNAKQSILDIFNTTKAQSQTRADAYSEIGIDPKQYFADQKSKMAEIDTLNQEYNALKAAAEQQKAGLLGQGRGITTDFLNNQAAQIDRNAAPKLNMLSANINSKAALMQAAQGNFNEARDFVSQAVEDATADKKFQFDTAMTFYNMNQDSINRLDTKYQNALNSYLDSTKTAYENARADKTAIGNLMLEYPKAGIGLNDDVFSAQQKAAKWSASQPVVTSNAISNQTTDNERALLNQFNSEPIVKDYNTILAKKMSVDAIIKSGVGGPGDLALVYEFMKGLDPTSVVRESEYATAAKSGNIFAGALSKFNGYFKETGGFMPKATGEAFQSIVNSKLGVQTQLYNNVKKQYEGVAGRQGLNPQNVVLDYGAGAVVTTPPAGPQSSAGLEEDYDKAVNTESSSWIVNAWNKLWN